MTQERKLHALITRWRHAANEATTTDAAVTYTDCADALEAAIAAQILLAICEGCGITIPIPTHNRRRAYPDLPRGWSQCGVSRHRRAGYGSRLAAWCPGCRVKKASPVFQRRTEGEAP